MTAVLERPDTDILEETAKPCECAVTDHHPKQDCGESPVYRVTLLHTNRGCKSSLPLLYCKDCLDALLDRMQLLVGYVCRGCGYKATKVSDLIGSVTPI